MLTTVSPTPKKHWSNPSRTNQRPKAGYNRYPSSCSNICEFNVLSPLRASEYCKSDVAENDSYDIGDMKSSISSLDGFDRSHDDISPFLWSSVATSSVILRPESIFWIIDGGGDIDRDKSCFNARWNRLFPIVASNFFWNVGKLMFCFTKMSLYARKWE